MGYVALNNDGNKNGNFPNQMSAVFKRNKESNESSFQFRPQKDMKKS
jgi:hypothetical protein